MDETHLNEFDDSILRFIKSDSPKEERIVEEFDSLLEAEQIKASIKKLKAKKYIKDDKHLNSVVFIEEGQTDFEIDPSKFDNVYVITKIGENYLSNPKHSQIQIADKKSDHKWFWWVMGVVGGLIVILIGAYVFGVGR